MTTEEARTILQSDPVAKTLLQSVIPARLAYAWRDGKPRVVPMWFHWTGEEFLMGAPPNAPKMKVLSNDVEVAFSIDSNEWPYQLLSVRGVATIQTVAQPFEETFPEYPAMAYRYLGQEGGHQFLGLAGHTFSHWTRIAIRPEEVRILDFQTRFPSAWSTGDHS